MVIKRKKRVLSVGRASFGAKSPEAQEKRRAQERLTSIREARRAAEQKEIDRKRQERIKSIQIEQNLLMAEKRLKATKKKKSIFGSAKKKRRSSSW